jgi:two-component system, NtrC family, sensor kinase
MRWGILLNLVVILAVSGGLLFLVFAASVQRSAVDLKMREAANLSELLAHEIEGADSSYRLWDSVRNMCRGRGDLGVGLYDTAGRTIVACGIRRDVDPPDSSATGARLKVSSTAWPSALFRGVIVTSDITKGFPYEVGTVRVFLEIAPTVSTPAWRLFAAYLILTQGALFFLGYILFHRTVIGPLSEAARLAAEASGIVDRALLHQELSAKGDIQKISAGLRTMLMRIVQDRQKMEALVAQLRTSNEDLHAAQQGLVRSEKLASVGRLAAGLAHEIGNPLQILMGYAELLQRPRTPDATDEIATRMEQELKRIHQILRGLLDFARPLSLTTAICDLNALVMETAQLIEGRKGFRHIEMEYVLDPEVPLLQTDAEKVRQIVLNLLFNAIDAIPETGGWIAVRTRSTGEHVEIEIEDNGSGILEEHLGQVFDPFFTTKEPGKGTGLGLAVCLGLAESLGGSLDVKSGPGGGTTVLVALPRPKQKTDTNSHSNA